MAVVKIHPISQTLHKAIAYITQDAKTNSGILCSSNCAVVPSDADNITAVMRSALADAEVKRGVGRPGSVLAFHVIQSFKPGEVDANTAHEIGWKFAQTITGGEHDLVVATHVDRGHIHNHIIFCSANRVTGKRYRNPNSNLKKIRKISDELVKEYGLSVIEPEGRGQKLSSIYADAYAQHGKEFLRFAIDDAVQNSHSWQAMVDTLAEWGVTVSTRGAHILFDCEQVGRAVRGKTLGENYTEQALHSRLGREAMSEFIVAKNLVTRVDDKRWQVRIPGKKPAQYFVVSDQRIIDHGRQMRLYLPASGSLTILNHRGQIDHPLSVEDLYQSFTRPTPIMSQHPHVRVERGTSAAQKRYFSYLDSKIESIKDDAATTSLLAEILRDTQPEDIPLAIESKLTQAHRRLNLFIAQRQKLIDKGQTVEGIDQKISAIQEQQRALLTLQKQLEKRNKERNR
ncbi:relaxase/mobilization nuclease domain-containing protein [Arcanobacterium phocisimile]|uniref:Relaxase/mobilization nuclease domain-containing protein n=1 Tax=Arcanobacterium phocisimile TaxID=1302235 RepID=A0ABX7IIX7_9ACTO|nr:relaxase/mobilization nuclease domain-containing protein [Arcanobacterium phocisimile]QRV02060.1 relaxase/mobilization nuclease domain-containing protein [Arcanobacterium phocisimile]